MLEQMLTLELVHAHLDDLRREAMEVNRATAARAPATGRLRGLLRRGAR